MGAGRNGNNPWEWEGNGNGELKLKSGMETGMNHWKLEEMGFKKDIPAHLY